MTTAQRNTPPATNLSGLRRYWRSDLVAGFSVALVALPLALGIATAAGAPPISGLVSAIVAGVLTTFLRGSHVAINGPGNALIVIVAGGFIVFGTEDAFSHILGAMVVAGALQIVFGLFRLGKLGDLIPAAVVQGMLAAIGLIIVSKQAHVLFGGRSTAQSAIDVFLELPTTLASAHPAATFIGVVSLLLLLLHPRIKVAAVHYIPAPLWVVIFAIPAALMVQRYEPALTAWFGTTTKLDASELVSIPDDLLASLVSPSFERINEPGFWMVVLTVTLVCSIENLISVKAVDKLDTHRRSSNLDRDLVATGGSTIVSAFFGGLPILTVVARSSVNVNHGAVTGWSNFFHGSILLVFVVFLRGVIEEISLSALAAILIYTGFKLAAPQVVRDTVRKGPDHFLVFGVTVLATLVWGLLAGIAIGVAAEFLSHQLILGLPPREAWRLLRESGVEGKQNPGEPYLLRMLGVANFLAIGKLRRAFDKVPKDEKQLVLDFSGATLVDNTLLEYCHDRRRVHERSHEDASLEIVGLEVHRSISDHPDALRAQERRNIQRRLTPRQSWIERRSQDRGWDFDARRDWEPEHLDEFQFFRVHPIEYRETVVHGSYEVGDDEVRFWLGDVTFDEGALIPEVYHTTAQVISLPTRAPEFVLEKEGLIERALEFAGFQDIDLPSHAKFSRKFRLQGPDEEAIRAFMGDEVVEFLEEQDNFYIESTGHDLVVFKSFMRIATEREIDELVLFTERLVQLVVGGVDAPD